MRSFLRSLCLFSALFVFLPQASFGFLNCVGSSVAPLVDEDGVDELTGDILLTCTRRFPGNDDPSLPGGLILSLNVDVTNPITAPDLTDVQLIVNENRCASPSATGGTFGSCGAPDPRYQDPQFGRRVADNRLEWTGTHIPIPGNPDGQGGTNPEVTTLRITGVRGHVAQLGNPDTPVPDRVVGFVSLLPTIPVANNALDVAFPVGDPGSTPAPPGPPGVTCFAVASAPAVAADSSDELLGDIVFTCTGGLGASSPDSAATINVSAVTNIDNSNQVDFGSGADVSDAVLVINNNECASPSPVPGSSACGAPDDRFQDPQYGRLATADRIAWDGVVFPIPGAPDGEGGFNPAVTTIRLRNLRGAVAQLGVPATATFPSTQVTAFISVLNVPLTNNLLNVGAPIVGAASNTSAPDAELGTTTCIATAVPPVIRAEGIAEATGDIVYVCTATPPAGGFVGGTATMDFSTSLNTAITNNIGFGPGADVTDAVLIINENNCISPAAAGSTFANCQTPDPRFQDPQFGRLAAPNRLEWNDVSFPIPGAPDGQGGTNPLQTTVRITGIRSNASELGIPVAATFPSTQVNAFNTIQGNAVIGLTNNILNVAVPIVGLIVDAEQVTGLRCVDDGAGEFTITLSEGFATAWKTTGVPSFATGVEQWESGYYAPGSNNGGGASHSTRFRVSLFSPSPVELTAPIAVQETARFNELHIRLLTGTDESGLGGTLVPDDPAGFVFEIGAGETAVLFYEVLDSGPFTVQDFDLGFQVVPLSDDQDPFPDQSITAEISYAPVSVVNEASAAQPEPRFAAYRDPDSVYLLAECNTTLLFPFLSDRGEDNARVTIANPTGVNGNSAPRPASCTLHYHGEIEGGGAPPADQTSTVIQPGEFLEFTLAQGGLEQGIAGAPEFEGYLIAECGFADAEGRAAIGGADGKIARSTPEIVPTDLVTSRPVDRQRLLFPYLSSKPNEHSVVVFSNTTQDWLGSTAENGNCSIEFFGENGVGPLLVGGFEAGEVSDGLDLSLFLTDFEGFAIAECEFPQARGFSRTFGNDPEDYVYGVEPILIDPAASALTEANAAATTGSALLLHGIEDKNTLVTKLEFANYGPAPAACSVQPTTSQGVPLTPVPVAVPAMSPATLDFDVAGTFTGWMLITCDQSTVEVVARSLATDDGEVVAAFAQNAERLDVPRTDEKNFVVYPFVESVEGVDARVSITNTSLDSLGSAPVSNACTLSFHGEVEGGSTPADANFILAPGEQLEFSLFQGLPQRGIPGALGFRGFLVASCEGALARGFDYRQLVAEPSAPAVCEVDDNPGIDNRDIQIIRQSRGQLVEEGDPRDFDGDGRITLNDRNLCRARCTLPRCALVTE